MPSVGAMEIVNKLFSGSKDVSSEVADAMNTMTAAAIEQQKVCLLYTSPSPRD